MVKLALFHFSEAKKMTKIANQNAAAVSLDVLLSAVLSAFGFLAASGPTLDSQLRLRYTKNRCSYADFFESTGAGHDAQTHIST
jgi:hypothetical protein